MTHCNTPMEPVHKGEGLRLVLWLCVKCGHTEKPTGREYQIKPVIK